MMRVLMRVDASNVLGTGHVMRCLALADALVRRGGFVAFAMCALPGHLIAEVQARGYTVYSWLPPEKFDSESQSDWLERNRLESTQLADASSLRADTARAGVGWDWLVVDHYALGAAWHAACCDLASKMFVIDDLADRPLHADIVLNQNPGAAATTYAALVDRSSQLLMGCWYALLRSEFAVLGQARSSLPWRAKTEMKSPPSPRVLVSLGGADAQGNTLAIVRALGACGLRGVDVTVVAGARNPFADQLSGLCAEFGFSYLPSTDKMAELMGQADFAVGAGGVSMIERFAMGLASLVVPIAANQLAGVLAAELAGAIVVVDPMEPAFDERLQKQLQRLLDTPLRVAAMSEAASALCDAHGALRVLELMQQRGLVLHRAGRGDAERIYAWRNSAQTRQYSGNPSELAFEQHVQWLDALLANDNKRLWIASISAGPIGVARLDSRLEQGGRVALISVYLVPGVPSQGWGRALIRAAMAHGRQTWPDLSTVIAQISGDNLASLRAFAACGFVGSAEPGWFECAAGDSTSI